MSKKVRFTVKGNGEFPQDMLRYDNCVAATPEDEAKIDWSYEDEFPEGGEHGLYRREVNLIATFAHKWQEPTKDRWESFDWKIARIENK
jgi:hypothetical protein